MNNMLDKYPKISRLFGDASSLNNRIWSQFDEMIEEYSSAFNSTFHTYEEDGKLNYSIDLPGVKEKDLSVLIENGYVKVEAKRSSKGINEEFSTKFKIPSFVETNSLEALLEDGVLTVSLKRIPEIKETEKPKQIEVKTVSKKK